MGTRLRSALADKPKPMVEIDGRPFLEYQIKLLAKQGFTDILLCTGYKHEVIENYFGNGEKLGLHVKYSVESKPYGTAGALRLAGEKLQNKFILLNGDTYIDMPYYELADKMPNMLVVSYREDTTSYGTVLIENQRVIHFKEKVDTLTHGYVNCGVYLFNKKDVLPLIPRGKSSLEYGVLPKLNLGTFVIDSDFFDIGTPDRLNIFKEVMVNASY